MTIPSTETSLYLGRVAQPARGAREASVVVGGEPPVLGGVA